jgi:uracil phosphoribosyltransferase
MPAILMQAKVDHLYMKIRDKNTSNQDFRRYGRRLMQVLCEEAMGHLAVEATIDTPVEGQSCTGPVFDQNNIVAVSIIRAADSMLDTFMNVVPEAAVGKILIQRDEETAQPKLFYDKLPPLAGKQIILLDPMLATGGSAACAIEVLLKAGATISKIMFINVLGCPEGMAFLAEAYPELTIFTGKVDVALNAKKYIVPGLGDYGDRFFGTV